MDKAAIKQQLLEIAKAKNLCFIEWYIDEHVEQITQKIKDGETEILLNPKDFDFSEKVYFYPNNL